MNVFEKIIAKEIPAEIVYEDEHILAFKDINPMAKVHVLIIPKKIGYKSVNEIDLRLIPRIFNVAKKIAKRLDIAESGYRIVTNVGDDANQTVHHVHFHLIGGEKLGKPC